MGDEPQRSLAGAEGVVPKAAAHPASSGSDASGRNGGMADARVEEWLQVAARSRVGPKLDALRDEHYRAGLPLEKYSMSHVYKLGTAQHAWVQQPRLYCKNIHRKRDRAGRSIRCTQCTTCHWCRQKTTCLKTQCSVCHGNRDNKYGGPYAGVICGNCLWTRFGENLNEVLQDPTWTCPACREICNCSANNCVRSKHGWICTDQINMEATSLGYESVAHYLVLAQLDETTWANITSNINSLQPAVDKAVVARAAALRRSRAEEDAAGRLHSRTARAVENELAAVHLVVGFSASQALEFAKSNQRMLVSLGFGQSTLAADLADDAEDEDEEDEGMPAPAGLEAARSDSRQRLQARLACSEGMEPSPPGDPTLATLQRSETGVTSLALGKAKYFHRRHPLRLPDLQIPSLVRLRMHPASDGAHGQQAERARSAPPDTAAPWVAATSHCQSSSAALAAKPADPPCHAAGDPAASDHARGNTDADGFRHQPVPEMEGLLHRDQHASFPVNLPEGNCVLTTSSRPGQQRPVRGQSEAGPGQPALSTSFAMQQQLGNRKQRPSHELGCKETESAAGTVTAVGATLLQQADASFGHGAAEEAADPSQHLGLSPDAHTDLPRGQDTAAQSGADEALPSRSLALELTEQQSLTLADGSADCELHVRRFSSFSSEWGHLLRMAEWLCEEVRCYAGGQHGSVAATRQAAEDHYKSVLQSNETALQAILAEANHRLTEPLVVGTVGAHNTAISADDIAPLIELYILFANVMPHDVVKWQVVPRLLCQDCFVEMDRSDPATRWALVDGMLCLLETLWTRGTHTQDTCKGITGALSSVARDVHRASELLTAMLAALQESSVQQLPLEDMVIGNYKYDGAERGKDVGAIILRARSLYTVLEDLLQTGLWQMVAAARMLQHDACQLLDSQMFVVLLAAKCGMPREVKLTALALVFTIVSLSSAAQDSMELSVAESNRRRVQRLQLCKDLKEMLPVLEDVLAQEYPLWQPKLPPSTSLGTTSSLSAIGLSPAGARKGDNLSQEAMTTLTRAYAFLLQCQQMTWLQFEESFLRPYPSPLAFWLNSNRAYRCVGMALLTETLQHARHLQPLDQRSQLWVVKHWMLSLLDCGRRYTTAGKLTQALSVHPQLSALFVDWGGSELSIGNDRTGCKTAPLLEAVLGRFGSDPTWRPLLGELLQNVDDVLERRLKDTGSTAYHTSDRLRYGARLYRLLAAVIKATALATQSATATQRAPSMSGHRRQLPLPTTLLMQLAQRMAMLALESCVAAKEEAAAMDPRGQASDSLDAQLRGKGVVRQSLQKLPYGDLAELWRVLLVLGAPQGFADPALLRPLWTVVSFTMDFCTGCQGNGSRPGEAEQSLLAFEQVVLECLAASFSDSEQCQLGPLRHYVVATFVMRYLSRSHWHGGKHERAAVNAVRFLEAMLEATPGTDSAQANMLLLPLLQPLIGALWPSERGAKPSLAVREAVYSMLAHLLHRRPKLLPALGPSANLQPAQIAYQSFWAVAVADAGLCCQQAVLGCLGEAARQELQAELETHHVPPTLPQLPTLTDEVVASATNAVARALGIPQHSVRPLEELAQRHGQQLELLLRESVRGNDAAKHSFRPPDFVQAAALAAVQLVGGLLTAGQVAAPTPAALDDGPAQLAASGVATLGSWQDLAPGHQWALASIPALAVLGRAQVSQHLRTAWRELQDAAGVLLPSYTAVLRQMLQQPQRSASDYPCASNSRGPRPPQQQRHAACLSVLPNPLQQLQPAQSACLQRARQEPGVHEGLHEAADVPFPRLRLLPARARVTVWGTAVKCSEAKAGSGTVLKVQLRDGQQRRLVVLMRSDHVQYQLLKDQAGRHLAGLAAGNPRTVRFRNVMLLNGSTQTNSLPPSNALPPCKCDKDSRVEWIPLEAQCDMTQRLSGGQENKVQPTLPPSQLTPHMHWSQQQGTMAQQLSAAPAATQVAEAGNTVLQGQAAAQSRMVNTSQAQLSQAPRHTCTPQLHDVISKARGPWQEFALSVVALCKPRPAAAVIQTIKALSTTAGGKDQLLAHGPQHVAALVLSSLKARSITPCT